MNASCSSSGEESATRIGVGTLVEKTVARRLMFDCAKFSLMPPEQFGGVMAASCVDAGLSLTHDIESALNRGHTASLLTVDVKGLFDNIINHQQLLFTLHSTDFPAPILTWTSSFLTDRSCQLRIDSFLSPPRPLNTGVPQGSPVSPILSVIYSSPVSRALSATPSLSPLLLYPTTVRSYIDDFSFLAIGADTTDTTDALRLSLSDIQEQLHAIGMTMDPAKSELIHFSRRRDPHLLRPLILNDAVIPASPVVRWLGIFFDPTLSFNKHVEILCNRARTAATGLRVLSNSVRGLSQKHLRALHKTVILPIITYASPLWFRPDRPQSSNVRKLDTIQNISLRLICGAFRTTPVKGLHVLAHQPPILETLTRFSTNAARRISRIPSSSPVFQRLPDSWRKASKRGHAPIPTLPVLPHNQSTTRYLTPVEHHSSFNHPKGERMFQFPSLNAPHAPHLLDHPRFAADTDAVLEEDARLSLIRDINNRYDEVADSRCINQGKGIGIHLYFCDGSQKDGRAGAGVHHIHGASQIWDQHAFVTSWEDAHPAQRTTDIRVGGGKRVTSYDAEMLALAIASRHILNTPPPSTRSEVNIFSDSIAALKNITDPSPHPAQAFSLIFITNITSALERFPDLKITLDWCPGHSKVAGNERSEFSPTRLDRFAVSSDTPQAPTSKQSITSALCDDGNVPSVTIASPTERGSRSICQHLSILPPSSRILQRNSSAGIPRLSQVTATPEIITSVCVSPTPPPGARAPPFLELVFSKPGYTFLLPVPSMPPIATSCMRRSSTRNLVFMNWGLRITPSPYSTLYTSQEHSPS